MSKKGFKKLEDHEMKSFGGGDSGSETELYLSPTTSSIRSKGWYSWCFLLYMVLLTILILLLCIFMAFMAYTMKVIADNCSSVETRLDGVKDDLSSLRDSGSHSGKGLVADLRSLNHSLLRMESTYELSHQQMELTMDGLFNRMAVLETTRQDGAVSNGMEQLYKEIGALNNSMRQLVGPSGDIQNIMKSIDSITTSIDSYDSQLRDLRRDHGDLSANQATMATIVEGIKGSLSDLQAEVNVARDSALERNKVLYQSIELLASQLAQMEAAVQMLNQSLIHEPVTPSTTTASLVQHVSLENAHTSTTAPPQPTMKPELSVPLSSTSPPSTSLLPTSTSLPSISPPSPSPSPSLHLQSSQVATPPQSTPLAGNSSGASFVGSLTPAPATLPQTPVPKPLSDTPASGMRNGTETNASVSTVVQNIESQGSVPSPTPADWERTFNATDTNADGKLTASEFISSFGADGEAVFKVLDTNGDSSVTHEEMQNALQKNQSP